MISKALSLGLSIALGLCIPIMIGVYVNERFNFSPWGILIGIVVGLLCAFGALWELIRK